jgi:hypothetical protein
MVYKSDPRGSAPVRLIAVHTAEGSRTAASLGSYFYAPATQASSHVGIDAGATLQYVDPSRSAWTIRSGNPVSENAELCGFAAWTREQWLGSATVDGCVNPIGILNRTADWVRARCLARNIPIRKLTPAQVGAGMSGVIGHIDWTLGMHDGTHTDPGSGFPWDYVIARASAGSGGVTPSDDEEDLSMEFPAGTGVRKYIPCNGKTSLFIQQGFGHVVNGHLWFIKDTQGSSAVYGPGSGNAVHIDTDRPGPITVPPGTRAVAAELTSDAPFTAWCY